MNAFARFEDWLDTFGEPNPQPTRIGSVGKTFVFPLAQPSIASDDPQAAEGWHLFEHAFAWVPAADVTTQPAPAAPTPAPRPPAIEVQTILRELDLVPNATPEQLQRARRRFMWENHPDRRTDIPPETANRRVAIANMLFDRALKAAGKRASASRR